MYLLTSIPRGSKKVLLGYKVSFDFRTRLPLQMRTVAFSRLKELQGKLELAIATAKLSDNDSDGDVGNGPMVNINDLTDLEDHSHSESDWEAEFNNEKGSESGADSGNGFYFYGLLSQHPIIDQSENKIIRPWEKKLSQREGNWKFDFQSDRPKTDSIL